MTKVDNEAPEWEIATKIARRFESITKLKLKNIYNKPSGKEDQSIFNQKKIDKAYPRIKKWIKLHYRYADVDKVMEELDDILQTEYPY
jgi:beta-galactosidase beta subunit